MSSEQLLPYLNPSVLNRQYRFSGQCPGRAYTYMLLGLLLSPISNVAAWILFMLGIMAILLGTAIIAIIPLLFTQLIAIVIALGIAVAMLLSPGIVGAMVGYAEAYMGRWGKCRSPKVGAIMGAIASFIGAMPFSALVVVAGASESGAAEAPPIGFAVFMFAFLGACAAAGGAIGGYRGIKEGAFCESCGVWYGKWSPAVGLDIKVLDPLARALNEKIDQPENDTEGIVVGIEGVSQVVGEQYPNVMLQTRRCPNCSEADVQWKATVNWKKNESKKWFVIVLPSQFSDRLEKDLFSPQPLPVAPLLGVVDTK